MYLKKYLIIYYNIMGRTYGSKTHKIYKFKCTIFTNNDKEEIKQIKLFSTYNDMSEFFNVSKRSLPSYVNSEKRRFKLNHVFIKEIKINRFNTDEVEYDDEFIKNL